MRITTMHQLYSASVVGVGIVTNPAEGPFGVKNEQGISQEVVGYIF